MRLRLLPLLPILAVALHAGRPTDTTTLLVNPYLQLGGAPAADALSLLWHAPDRDAGWAVELSTGDGPARRLQPTWVRVAVPTVAPHRVYTAVLRPLAPGAAFSYQVLLDGRPVFQGAGRARKGPGQPQRVAVAGDLAMGTAGPRAVARQLQRLHPDLVVVPGDLVYQDGRISEYRRAFFPTYNAGGDPAAGGPFMAGTLFVAALGNHDVGERGPRHPQAADPDALAYYLYWDQPLNGPALRPEGPHAPPLKAGADWTWDGFLAAAGRRFPTMGSFSFDSGDVHWTVLDSNPYVRWDDPGLRRWLARDLAQAQGAVWRFVVFHHPAFNLADGNLYVDQWMSRLWPLFERWGVDLVFTGHIHAYARTQPIRFTPEPDQPGLDPATQQGQVAGKLAWDAAFDGRGQTRAEGVIHILTGGGGAPLHLKGRDRRLRLKPYVARTVTGEHSFSLLDITGRSLTFRQIGTQGEELDRFTLAK